jgi:predicted component of type VI protein secretion system
LLPNKKRLAVCLIGVAMTMTACISLPERKVYIRRVDFEVAADANNGKPFVCHIVIARSHDLLTKLQAMDAPGYFSVADSLSKTYKDAIEVFKYDLIPGRNKLEQDVDVKARTAARGAFLFAKYLQPGRYHEAVGETKKVTVRFLSHKMEVHSDIDLETFIKKMDMK